MEKKFYEAIDSLRDDELEEAFLTFLLEKEMLGEFLVWIEKWKSIYCKS